MKRLGIVFVVLITCLSSMSWGLMLNNPNFDQTVIADGGWSGLPTGWTARGGNADQQNLVASTLTPPAQSGDNTAGLNGVSGTDGGSWISQVIKQDDGTTPVLVAANKTYVVKVWVGRRNIVEGTAGGILKVQLVETATTTVIGEATYDLQPNYPATTGEQAINSWTQQTLYVSTGAAPAGIGSNLQLRFRNVSSRTTQHWYQQVVLDNVEIGEPTIARSPSPANNATLVPIASSLSWTAPELYTPTGYNVYLTTDPNVPAGAKVSNNQAGTTYTPSSNLAYNTKYYWRVDALEPNTPNPIVHTGDVWNFTTVPTTPIIGTQPSNQLVASGATATLTIVASSPSTITYAWYQTPDAVNNTPGDDVQVGTNSATLSFAATADGYYYCKATNIGGSSYSNVANLAIKRQVAHWTLDALGGTGNQYVDSSPGALHPADANGVPTFVTGAGASTGNGVVITPTVGWASAGTWNPSQYSGQITISLWAKWTGDNGTWQGLIGKRNAWGDTTMMWQLEVQPTSGTVDFKNTAAAVSSPVLPIGTWENVVVVFNGTTATIYRNGVSAGSGGFLLNSGFAANMVLGAAEKSDAGIIGSTFNGAIDDIQIYNYAMSNTDVVDLFYRPVMGKWACINSYASTYDFDKNCKIDLSDLASLATQWLNCGRYPSSDCSL